VSVTVVCLLAGSFIVSYLLASCKDFNDSEKGRETHENHDLVQRFLIDYNRENLDENEGVCYLYFYMLKKVHPLLSLFFSPSPYFDRRIKVLDLFFRIFLIVYFTLMPLYYLPQYNSLTMAYTRDATMKDQDITNLPVTSSYVVYGSIFAVVASVITYFVASFVFFVIFQSVNSIEHEKLNEKNHVFTDELLQSEG